MGGAADSRIGKPIEQFVNDGLRFDIFPHIAKEAPPTPAESQGPGARVAAHLDRLS